MGPTASDRKAHEAFRGRVVANDGITFDIRRGEVHCLLGENGAGKSTLAKCLYGAYRPDSGTIRLKGQLVELNSPRDAIDFGIGMVHQHFILALPLTVLENIIVGLELCSVLLDLKRAEASLQELCQSYGISVDLHARNTREPSLASNSGWRFSKRSTLAPSF